tara:strand:- start:1218 stop:1601 length:384 start_codon:yes stop_codon:yes gene_type:complete
MTSIKHILYVEDEYYQFINLFSTTSELMNVKLAFRLFKNKTISPKEFKKHICFYSVQACRNILNDETEKTQRFSKILKGNMEDEHQQRITKKQIYDIVDDLYHYKKYYKSNQNEYGEYNENQIFNKQ